jgi:hypothetical protein
MNDTPKLPGLGSPLTDNAPAFTIPFTFDRAWQRFPQTTHDELCLASNHLYHHTDAKVGALVAMRGKYAEFAVSKAGLDYLWAAVRDGRIPRGVVVLAVRDEGRNVVVKEMDVEAVVDGVKDIPAREGDWGPYWWFYSNGSPQRSQGTSYVRPLEDPPY